MRQSGWVTVLRWAEGTYALVAFVNLVSLQNPTLADATLMVHWIGSGLLAAMLAWMLARPNRVLWIVAAILAAYVLVGAPYLWPGAIRALIRLRGAFGAEGDLASRIAFAVGGLLAASQILALVALGAGRQAASPPPRRTPPRA